ncbi:MULTISPECIES: quinone oxidoreductase family protein [Paenibacillus]|jgi:NADPH:quinone reductase-like Zn-dependent oxidoreductase|uniref:quinone oxidoreductase family protein n=1 Tax=Paenibacillus TaxID=44249 RepID=UPI000FD85B91|nr:MULTISPECIES: zinc-binding alcohol dehydrogenase family protein [Paenibacillus]MDU0330989.1 zinc-binding alcohol dehydrogenase family protein [Paenibacillus sp. 3LSP]MEC2342790.1 zinc-binding alcohol dehydrogenase family protein [Paenibacillus barengoltzii]
MKAAIIHAKGQSPVYGEFDTPVATDGKVLVHVKASALSNLSRALSEGNHYSADAVYPKVAGAEGVGITADGQRVYFLLPEAPYGALAEQTLVRPDYMVKIPDTVDDITAAAIPNPAMSSWVALNDRAHLQPNETVLINGATGTAGRLAVQIAKHLGAKKVIATGRNERELQELHALGADVVVPFQLDGTEGVQKFEKALEEQFAEGIDVIIDYLWGESARSIIMTVYKCIPKGHIVRFVNVGASSGQENIDLPSSVLRSSAVQILGSGLGSVIMPKFFEAIRNVYEIVKTANLQVNTKVVPLSSVESVWGDSSGKPRVVFTIN